MQTILRIKIYRNLPLWLRALLVRVLAPKHGVGVVGVIFNAHNQVLILHQTYDEPYRLPGGIMEYGEEPEETIRRELIEEAQCVVEPMRILGISRISRYKFDVFVLCRLVEEHEFIPNPEVTDRHWRTICSAEADSLQDLPPLHQRYIELARHDLYSH